jgi:hypothetical protein
MFLLVLQRMNMCRYGLQTKILILTFKKRNRLEVKALQLII